MLKTLKRLAAFDADVVIPGHGVAIRDKGYLKLSSELFQSVIDQTYRATQDGIVTVEEMQKAVNVEAFREKFTHGDKELNDGISREQ